MANKVRLTICGSSYVISTNESEDYMQNLAERLNLDMNELMSSSNSVSITTAAIVDSDGFVTHTSRREEPPVG